MFKAAQNSMQLHSNAASLYRPKYTLSQFPVPCDDILNQCQIRFFPVPAPLVLAEDRLQVQDSASLTGQNALFLPGGATHRT